MLYFVLLWSYKRFATKFCTCHDSFAVVTCAKFGSDLMTSNHVIALQICHPIRIVIKNYQQNVGSIFWTDKIHSIDYVVSIETNSTITRLDHPSHDNNSSCLFFAGSLPPHGASVLTFNCPPITHWGPIEGADNADWHSATSTTLYQPQNRHGVY